MTKSFSLLWPLATRHRPLYLSLLLAITGTGCQSIGPGTVPRDRSDYSSSIGDSWKRQTLLNIVKLRYVDPPIFVDVGQIVAGYSLQTGVSAGGTLSSENAVQGNFGTIGGSAIYTDRPTITYVPLTGNKFLRGLMTPLLSGVGVLHHPIGLAGRRRALRVGGFAEWIKKSGQLNRRGHASRCRLHARLAAVAQDPAFRGRGVSHQTGCAKAANRHPHVPREGRFAANPRRHPRIAAVAAPGSGRRRNSSWSSRGSPASNTGNRGDHPLHDAADGHHGLAGGGPAGGRGARAGPARAGISLPATPMPSA